MRPHLAERAGARLDWVELASGTPQDLLAGRFQIRISGEICRGVRVFHGHAEPGEVPQGYVLGHLLTVNVGEPMPGEFYWPGRGWKTDRVGHLGVNLFPAGMPYSVRWRQPAERILVEIAPEDLASLTALELGGGRVELRPAAAIEDPFLAHLALALLQEVRAGAPGGRICGESLATALLAHLLRTRSDVRLPAQGASLSKAKLGLVLEHIAGHLGAGLSLRGLADLVQMDVFRFVRAFKKSTGLPPHRYVLQVRIDRAKTLLRDPMLSIGEVALQTGFATPSHFSTTFRRMTRTTPRSFREALR
jgi:AraC family transcriptional regulator